MTVNEPVVPTVNVVALLLVIAEGWLTVNTKDCVAVGATPFAAVIVRGYEPPVDEPGVPLKVAVPFVVVIKLTPVGNDPLMESVAVGNPVVVTLKVLGLVTVKVVLLALEMDGASVTVMGI